MYDNNYIAKHLRAASIGRDDALFAKTLDGNEISYAQMFEHAEKIAKTLIDSNLKPGDRVAVQVDKSIEAIQLYLGTILAGGVFLPLNTAYTPAELDYFLGDATPVIFVCEPEKLSLLKPLATAKSVKTVFTLSSDGTGSLIDSLVICDETFKSVPRDKDDLASLLYTSGTTGRSKGAMLTHHNLISNAKTLKQFWQFENDDVLIHALPIFHIHGLFVAINTTLCAGSSLIFMTRFDPGVILEQMKSATVLMGVPTFYVRLLDTPGLSQDTVSTMRLFISGSAPLLSDTHAQWQKVTGHAILERYGMTETNMNTSNPYSGDRRAGTVGFPLPGVEIKIADPKSGIELAQGEIGSVEIRGPNVFSGYWKMPDKTQEEFTDDGYFISGDTGFIDDKGYLSIVGRYKDLIITGGYNVYPKEIEELIDDVEGVLESAVIGLPHPDFGEGVAAVVVKENGAIINEADIQVAINDQLAKFKQPKQIIFISELPRNTMGKVLKNILRDAYQNYFTEILKI